ncbi:MAG: hypothetical protein ABEH81_15765 [Halopenitus sp.]
MEYNLKKELNTTYAHQYYFAAAAKHRVDLLATEIVKRASDAANIKFIDSLRGVYPRTIRIECLGILQAFDSTFWQPWDYLNTTGQVSIDVLTDHVVDE